MPNNPKLELDAMGLPVDPQAREVAIGRMMERLNGIDRAEAAKQTTLVEQAKAQPAEPLVKIEWIKTPQRGSCTVQSKAGTVAYNPRPHRVQGRCTTDCRHGPVQEKGTGRILRPGTSEQVPADHARVIVEGQYARVTDGYDDVRWTHSDFVSGIDSRGPDPANEQEWAALAHN